VRASPARKTELVAIQKNHRDQASKVAAEFRVPRACTTSEELLAADGVQAVVVSSIPHWHYPQAAAALRMAKHVFIEKSMTITAGRAAVRAMHERIRHPNRARQDVLLPFRLIVRGSCSASLLRKRKATGNKPEAARSS